jgi:hypothetical protein
VRGVFTTTKYEDRAAFTAARPFEVVECTNHFTDQGLKWMWSMMAGLLRQSDGTLNDHLGSGRVLVGNGDLPFSPADTRLSGDQTAQVDADAGYPVVQQWGDEDIGGWRLVFRATFGEDQAVFDWQERGIVTAQGVLIDRSVSDQGRKVLGAIWQLEIGLELAR